MNYSFFVEKDYEIISGLQEGHYKLKSIDYFIESSYIPAGELNCPKNLNYSESI